MRTVRSRLILCILSKLLKIISCLGFVKSFFKSLIKLAGFYKEDKFNLFLKPVS